MTQYLHELTLVPSTEWAMTRERVQKELSREENKEKKSNKERFEIEKQWDLMKVLSSPHSFMYANGCLVGKSSDIRKLAAWKYHVYGPDIKPTTIFDTQSNIELNEFEWSPIPDGLTPVPILEYIMDQSWFGKPEWYEKVQKQQKEGKKYGGNEENLESWIERGFFHKVQNSYVLFHAGAIRGQSKDKEKLMRAAKELEYSRFELAAIYHLPDTPKNLLK